MKLRPLAYAIAITLSLLLPAQAQQLLHQPTDASDPVAMPTALLDRIDDPFFNIAINATPQPTDLVALINTLLDGGRSDFQTFVVGEQIGRDETANECGPASRRQVISFIGTHAPTGTVLDGNLFLSVFMSPGGPVGAIEVIAWDQTHRTYNYYKIEEGSWRFRNHSSDLETASADDLAGGCLACHVNGGPVMKEFTFPWNHWHGLPNTFEAPYLAPGGTSWPVANSDFMGPRLTGAQILESSVQSSLQRFIGGQVEDRITVASDGTVTVSDLPDLLDSLFRPTELNLGSSNISSGLDGGGLTQQSTGRMNIPDSFFVNIFQMRDIDLPVFASLGLVTQIFTPGTLGLSVDEYAGLLETNDIATDCMPGRDTMFPWFGPEPSEFDRRMVERLNKRGVIDDGFVAAALAIDFETPLFSDDRAALLGHIPQSVTADTRAELPQALRAAVIASLEATAPRSEPEDNFLSLLRDPDPVTALDQLVRDHLAQTQVLLSDPSTRGAHLQTLFEQLLANRARFEIDAVSARLNEFPGLMPRVDP